MTGRYLEDFAVGQTFRSGRLQIDYQNDEAVQVTIGTLVVPRRPT
jgi:CxxC motif-containing protein (DUF1111 family)